MRLSMHVLTVKGCFSAAEKVLQLKSRTDEQTMFLMSLLDALEQVRYRHRLHVLRIALMHVIDEGTVVK